MLGKRRIAFFAAILFSYLVVVSFLKAAVLAQPFEFVHEAAKRNNLLPVWLEFRDRKNDYLASPALRLNYLAAVSWVNST